jgi:hypothetical protein
MKKLTLDVDALAVESFPTAEVDEARGTVDAQEATVRCNTRVASCYTSCRAEMRDNCTCPV